MDHFYQNVNHHGWPDAPHMFTYSTLYTQMVKETPDPSHFVEIGSFVGGSAAFMAVEIINSRKKIRFDCVDWWNHPVGNLENFTENLKPVWGHFTPMKMISWEAAKYYKDQSLDFVFVDGDHSYEGVCRDIQAWLPKVKPGGVLAGHDYDQGDPGVVQAVQTLLPKATPYEGRCWFYRV